MRISLLWERVIVSRITILYFSFSVLHCIIQTIFQIRAFAINDEADQFLKNIIHKGQNSTRGFSLLDSNSLRWCDHVPQSVNADSCRILWSSEFPSGQPTEHESAMAALGGSNASSTSRVALTIPLRSIGSSVFPMSSTSTTAVSSSLSPNDNPVYPKMVVNLTSRTVDSVYVQDTLPRRGPTSSKGTQKKDFVVNEYDRPEIFIRDNCLKALNWPAEKFANTKREDVAFIGFQFWLFGMSLVAILNESIPHIVASLGTHVFATAWGIFQLAHTARFKDDFTRVITNGACDATDLLSNYWTYRSASEIPSLVFNGIALFLSMLLTWKLIKLFGWQTYKHFGSNMKVKKMYVCVLHFSIILQLGLFFMVVGIALWIDQVNHGAIGQLSSMSSAYKILFLCILGVMAPWLLLGWYAVRKESRIMMWIFVLLTFGYVGGFGAMFTAPTFRWTIITWPFFGLMEGIGAALAIAITVFSILCRLNFGKGLAQAFNAPEELIDENGFQDEVTSVNRFEDPEKLGSLADSHESLPSLNIITQGLPISSQPKSTGDVEVYLPYHMQQTVTRGDTQRGKKRWVIE